VDAATADVKDPKEAEVENPDGSSAGEEEVGAAEVSAAAAGGGGGEDEGEGQPSAANFVSEERRVMQLQV
jgi:hypothetical protein